MKKNFKCIFTFLLILYLCFNNLFKLHFKSKNDKYNEISFIKRDLSVNFRPDFTTDTQCTLPFVSASCFILFSDYVYDGFVKNVEPINKLKNGDVIFVRTEFVDEFFRKVFPKIKTKIILITHYSDFTTDKKHIKYLEDDKMIKWFGQNAGFEHKKLEPIPIGFEGTVWCPWQKKIKFLRSVETSRLKPWNRRKYLLYINFNSASNPKRRQYLRKFFNTFPNVLVSPDRTSYRTYMKHMENSKYVICPKGNGLDTHRFYEAVLMGSIPIVENSTISNLQSRVTSLILNDFRDLNMNMLKYPEKYIKNFNFSKEILYFKTWIQKIDSLKMEND